MFNLNKSLIFFSNRIQFLLCNTNINVKIIAGW